jgi:hypothetical protein
MSDHNRIKRLSVLGTVPSFAAADHRLFLDEHGNDTRLRSLPRAARRQIKADGKKLFASYKKLLHGIAKSGAGYPIDQLLRQLAIEYTHRYMASGLYTQPASFNYFESFCNIQFVENSVAPYAEPAPEVDHLFSLVDYLDFITDSNNVDFQLDQLKALPEGRTLHFTTNGDILDFTFLSVEGREFVISGFSMLRRGNSLHWYLVGGELLSDTEWETLVADQPTHDLQHTAEQKKLFLQEMMERNGNKVGAPVPLEGTKTALRTIIAGETDLISCKHVGRCYMRESENSFNIICDDPDIFTDPRKPSEIREELRELFEHMKESIEKSSVMWNLAESMFQLNNYFNFKISIAKKIAVSSGQKISLRPKSGGRGIANNYRYVSVIEFCEQDIPIIRSFSSPHYQVETNGFWRRIAPESYGSDVDGNSIRGRTWIRANSHWRERPSEPKTIYVKSSVAAAKVKVDEYVAKANMADQRLEADSTDSASQPETRGVLYVLRCIAMRDEIYKVGWTAGSAEERAKELSAATGVPVSFAVVDFWAHADPKALETNIHAMLTPYRINDNREFFKAEYPVIKRIIEAEISRTQSLIS